MAAEAGARPIRSEERSGVLFPQNLRRYEAHWIDPSRDAGAVVDTYWHVRWSMPPGEVVNQRIIDLPLITLTIEHGEVPAPLVVTGVHTRAWRRDIHGDGSAFAIRLRPAGLAVLSDLAPERLADAVEPVTPRLDPRLHALMARVAAERTPRARAAAADAAVSTALAERPLTRSQVLAGDVVDELRQRLHHRTGEPLSSRFGVSERTVQRALAAALGRGPKWLSRRIRLQEVARRLATTGDDLAAIAAELGYADHAHLTGEFRAVAGILPSAYRRRLARLTGGGPDGIATAAAPSSRARPGVLARELLPSRFLPLNGEASGRKCDRNERNDRAREPARLTGDRPARPRHRRDPCPAYDGGPCPPPRSRTRRSCPSAPHGTRSRTRCGTTRS